MQLADAHGVRLETVRAHQGIVDALGGSEIADGHGRTALAIYADLGAPEADELRRVLDATRVG